MRPCMLLCGALVLGLAAAPSLLAQEPVAPKAPQATEASSAEALVKDLASGEFAVREEATSKLRALGEAARPALEAAQEAPDLEQRMRVRALLSELTAKASEERLAPVGPRPGTRELRPQGLGPVGELDRDLEAMRRMMEEHRQRMRQGLRAGEWPFPGGGIEIDLSGPNVTSSTVGKTTVVRNGERLTLERHEDGSVKVTTGGRDPATGAALTDEVFEADSLEALQKDHPEVHARLEKNGLLGGILGGALPGGLLTFEFGATPGRQVRPRLGALVGPLPAVLRAHLHLDGPAVAIESVTPGSRAATLGLRQHDLIERVNEQPIDSAATLRRLIESLPADAPLRVEILRGGERQTLGG